MNEEKLREILEEFINELSEILGEASESMPEEKVEEDTGSSGLSRRTLLELVSHEGIVPEAYKDSKGIWTWGIGVTNASGHRVSRYKDNPQPISRVIEIFKWLVENKYLPDVIEAFNRPLTETQLAAALSFHYNTGAIGRASWVTSFNKGDLATARKQFMNWRSPSEIIPRREAERDLFFDGVWSNDGTATVYQKVNKPSYSPKWSSAKRVDISGEL